jgi:ribosomal protein S18 acetylase RimI-like enzyme
MYLARLAGQTFGTFVLQRPDEEVWGDVPEDAGYVYGLAIRRDFAGEELGRKPLRWPEEPAALSGERYPHLDCQAENRGLNRYYERAGFRRRGRARV